MRYYPYSANGVYDPYTEKAILDEFGAIAKVEWLIDSDKYNFGILVVILEPFYRAIPLTYNTTSINPNARQEFIMNYLRQVVFDKGE